MQASQKRSKTWFLNVVSAWFFAISWLLISGPLFSAPLFALGPSIPDILNPGQTVGTPKATVRLRALDKITARITELDVKIGQEHSFGTLRIVPRYCRTRDPIETPETFAFLEIDNIDHEGGRKQVFAGWMVASSPALNALEHPVYDVWVISCKAPVPVILG